MASRRGGGRRGWTRVTRCDGWRRLLWLSDRWGWTRSRSRSLLEGMSIPSEEESEAGLLVAVVDGYRRPELAELNARALREGRPWLLFRPVGRQIWAGPLFRPGVTGCWECLAYRLRTNSPVATYLESRDGRCRHRGPR